MRQLMKKIIFISFFLFFSAAFLYAVNPRDITLAIQGSGSQNFVDGFKLALTVEAKAAGYQITDNASSAKYNIKFTVEYDRTEEKSKFIVSLIKVDDSSVIVSMEYFFADEEEMMLYAQLVFFLLISNLPEDVKGVAEDNTWRDKWLYLNVSFDYSIMFLGLNDSRLKGGIGMWNGEIDNPNAIAPLDNKFSFMPGIGLGLEFQFLDFMSIEPRAELSIEEMVKGHVMYTALFSAALKFPLKFLKFVVIEPYGVAAYPIRFPADLEVFYNYPQFIFGAGLQVAMKAGKSGALFFDVSYLFINLGETYLKNQFAIEPNDLYPNPHEIRYDHSVLGFKIGYKFGFFNRKR
jgi:hypothetical protein